MASTGTAPRSQLSAPPENTRVQPSNSQSRTANVCARSSRRVRATRTEYVPSATPISAGTAASQCPSARAAMARRAKKRVRKRPRRSAGLRRLRGGRLTVAPSGSCVADEVRAACREYSRSLPQILQGQVKGLGWPLAGAAGVVGYNRCPVERTLFFSGNEAIAHGAVRAGAGFACGYPGTPSTEILETAARLEGIHAQWCVNEKVALETAVGASLAGRRTIVTMKHVGLNLSLIHISEPTRLGMIS